MHAIAHTALEKQLVSVQCSLERNEMYVNDQFYGWLAQLHTARHVQSEIAVSSMNGRYSPAHGTLLVAPILHSMPHKQPWLSVGIGQEAKIPSIARLGNLRS